MWRAVVREDGVRSVSSCCWSAFATWSVGASDEERKREIDRWVKWNDPLVELGWMTSALLNWSFR